MSNPAKHIAAILGLTGFLVASVAGLLVGNPAEVVLLRAILAMFACFVCGLPLGAAAGWVVAQHVASFKNTSSPPNSGGATAAATSDAETAHEIAEDGVMIV